MAPETYHHLSDVIRAIRPRIAAAWGEPDVFLRVWLRWADALVLGMYVNHMANRILEHRLRDPAWAYDEPRILLGQAAMLTVAATREGFHGDVRRVMRMLDDARQLVDRVEVERHLRRPIAASPPPVAARRDFV
jgi:hypothetical protein